MSWAEALDWHYWVHSVVGAAHVLSAIVALILGPLMFLNVKGAGFHRIAGYVFVLAMLTVNITALTLYDLNGRPNIFHALAILSLFSVISGFYLLQRAVRLKSERLLAAHARAMMWAYFGSRRRRLRANPVSGPAADHWRYRTDIYDRRGQYWRRQPDLFVFVSLRRQRSGEAVSAVVTCGNGRVF